MSPTVRSVVVAALLLLGSAAAAPAQLPPDARWRTFDTENFRIHFTPELRDLARGAAARAERAYALLAAEFVAPPPGRIDLIVTDNVDFANGFASPFPRNRIVVFAHPPADAPSLAFFDDWMELVITHELVHIFHLDHTSGVWTSLRGLFGRFPLLFPQILQPGWLVEGLATHYESRLTGAGRVRGTMHEMMLRTAALEGRFFEIDRATGDPIAWPGGPTRYVYGSMFVDFLVDRFGADAPTRLVERMGGRIVPYRLDAAARAEFGVRASEAWGLWRDSLATRYAALADSLRAAGLTRPELLSGAGGHIESPRHAPDGAVAYAADTRAARPSLVLLQRDGSARMLARLTTLGAFSWLPDGTGLLTTQLEYVDPYRIYADVYRIDRDGTRHRLTDGARIWDVDPHPHGDGAVVVRSEPGTSTLGWLDLRDGSLRPLLPPRPDVHWAAPRWSPDGTRIAAARWRTGGHFDIVVLDAQGGLLRELTLDRAVDATPAWSPDGRYVVFSSDRTGISNLYAYDLDAGRLLQATNVLTGAFAPDVSPDGRSIVFSLYGADGYRVARIPFEPGRWAEAPPVRPEVEAVDPERLIGPGEAEIGGPERAYSPFPTLLPTYWLPIFGSGGAMAWGVGALLSGADVVDRHRWLADAFYSPPAGRLDGSLEYTYAGLGSPVLDGAVSQRWSVLAQANTAGGPNGAPLPSSILQRRRRVDLGVTVFRPRLTGSSWVRAAVLFDKRHLSWGDAEAAGDLRLRAPPPQAGGSLDVGYSTARAFWRSIGPQEGFSVAGRVQSLRDTRGLGEGEPPRGYSRVSLRNRGYLPFDVGGYASHVLAARLDLSADIGSASPGLSLGGADGDGVPFALATAVFEQRAGFPLRGYPEGVQQGNRLAVGSLEYRVPISLVERGVGVLPVFFSRVWGDVFVDAGSAWCAGGCGRSLIPARQADFRPLVSVGAEGVFDVRIGYFVDVALRAGIAAPLRARSTEDGERRLGPQLYLRLGRSF
jgi:hypothetical protein